MSIPLRPYQSDLIEGVRSAWADGAVNVLAVSPTGSGKSLVIAHILQAEPGPSVVIAHRSELLHQLSLALARNGVKHRIIAPAAVRRECEALHMLELGRRWIDQAAHCAVAGVNTLVRAKPDLCEWLQRVRLWVCDEAAHLTAANQWGRAIALMPNARGLGLTATPCRSSGEGLGRHADGVMDAMVLGPTPGALIASGALSTYRVFTSRLHLDLSGVRIGATGDYQQEQLRGAVHKAQITGDVVEQYLCHSAGKRGLTFAVDIEAAQELTRAYLAAGVPAELVDGKTPALQRAAAIRKLRTGELLQLVNVEVLTEGTDVPAVETVSLARPTQSLALHLQMLGRALRPAEGKQYATVLDHVGNIVRLGLPDTPRLWSLDRRERASKGAADDAIPLRACAGCTRPYERVLPACPHCGLKPEPAQRGAPEQVEGDLLELDPQVLAAMRGEIDRVDAAPRIPRGLSGPAARAVHNNHLARQEAQGRLRSAIALWAGHQRALGRSDSEGYRRFWHLFGTDVATAQTLGVKQAEELLCRVNDRLLADGIVSTMEPSST